MFLHNISADKAKRSGGLMKAARPFSNGGDGMEFRKKVERGNTDTGRQQTPKMELY